MPTAARLRFAPRTPTPNAPTCVRTAAFGARMSFSGQRATVERVFDERAEVQRCQLRNAYAMTSYEDAKAALEKLFRRLERINPSAARSLEEGMEETLTLRCPGTGPLLRSSPATTNLVELGLGTVLHVARSEQREQGGDHRALDRPDAFGRGKQFRKATGFRERKELARKLNPELHSQLQVA